MEKFIKIPKNPKDLHSLKDLKKAYISVNEFISNLNDYFYTVVFSHFKTVDELLSEIPQNKWSDYIMADYKPNNYRYEKSEALTLENFYNTFYKKFKEDEKHYTVIGFFIDHNTKKIKQFSRYYRGSYNHQFTTTPKFRFVDNNIIEMNSDVVWRSGTYRKPGDCEETTPRNYYFDAELNTFICK